MRFLTRLREHAENHGEGDAVVSDATTLSWAELLQRVEAAAHGFLAQGAGSGSVVGLTVSDQDEHLVASLALFAVGAGQVTLASFDPAPVRQSIARRVGVTHRLAPDGPDTALEGLPVLRLDLDAPPSGPLPGAEGAIYLRTSGTTGTMNITVFTEGQLDLQAQTNALPASERLMYMATIEHNNAKRHRLYAALRGTTNVFRPTGPHDIADVCARYGVTAISAAPVHAAALAATVPPGVLAHLKLFTAGAPTPMDLRQAILRRITPHFFVRYGATECGSISMAGPDDHGEETVGLPRPGVEVEVVDELGRPVARGRPGEIRIRAPGMASGYLDNPEHTAKRFRDGWFWPGDMGRMREDGQLVVEGRKDDMMILNGVNVFPAEIERALERHPAVAAAAALPLASPIHGQIPVAAVELRPGTAATAKELQLYAREQLALRAPRRIVIVPAMPRTSQGKVSRRDLRPLFETRGTRT